MVGNGVNTNVWLQNWLLEPIPRPPHYRQEAIVDLILRVEDLIDVPTHSWNVDLICQLINEEDVAMVLQTRFSLL